MMRSNTDSPRGPNPIIAILYMVTSCSREWKRKRQARDRRRTFPTEILPVRKQTHDRYTENWENCAYAIFGAAQQYLRSVACAAAEGAALTSDKDWATQAAK